MKALITEVVSPWGTALWLEWYLYNIETSTFVFLWTCKNKRLNIKKKRLKNILCCLSSIKWNFQNLRTLQITLQGSTVLNRCSLTA